MGATIVFHDDAGLGRAVVVEFASNRQAMMFVEDFQYYGEFNRFNWDYVDLTSKRSNKFLKSSEELYKSIMLALYDKNYFWVSYIDCRQEGRHNHFVINGWDSKDNPNRVKVLYLRKKEKYNL